MTIESFSMDEKEISARKIDFKVSQYGVWRVLQLKESFMDVARFKDGYQEMLSSVQYTRRFVLEIYRLGPGIFVLYILSSFWSAMESAMTLYFSNHLLNVLENGLRSRAVEQSEVTRATITVLACSAVTAFIRWTVDRISRLFSLRVRNHFQEHLMRARLRLDLATADDHSATDQLNISHRECWRTFTSILDSIEVFISTLSQLGFVYEMTRSGSGGHIFVLLCVARPLLEAFSAENEWGRAYVAHSTNPHHIRMQAIASMVRNTEHRQEVINDGLGSYLLEEFQTARGAMGNVSDDDIHSQISTRPTPWRAVASSLASDLPMVFYAARSIYDPADFSVASLVTLQQTAMSLRWTFSRLLDKETSLAQHMTKIRRLYQGLQIRNKTEDGLTEYPKCDNKNNDGMALEFRNVTFKYPSSKTTKNALNDVSFTIKAGQLVVVVGANGSGKSSMVKLLTRLYDPTSGEILVDGLPMSAYRVADLRQATAVLSQDHTIYPLSIMENIGVGSVVNGLMTDHVEDAAKLGGAHDFISKLDQGFNTVLRPVRTVYASYTAIKDDGPLREEYNKMEKMVNISGGEKQRLVAARTFMRIAAGHIKLMAVDEPSSALDPAGEFELFERLRDARKGKTMIFVTHRFGHLTKHADLILVMKDGALEEHGTHEELLSEAGEYSKLYNVQAQAFV